MRPTPWSRTPSSRYVALTPTQPVLSTLTPQASARINLLAVGAYEIQVTLGGFMTVTTKTEVVSGDIMTIPVTLSVAAANQQVEVREEVAALNTVNVQLQQSTDNQTITDLPLNSWGF